MVSPAYSHDLHVTSLSRTTRKVIEKKKYANNHLLRNGLMKGKTHSAYRILFRQNIGNGKYVNTFRMLSVATGTGSHVPYYMTFVRFVVIICPKS